VIVHQKRERELGLDRRETGWIYPTVCRGLCGVDR